MEFDAAAQTRIANSQSWVKIPDLLGALFGLAFLVAVFIGSGVFAAAFLVCTMICWVQHKIALVRSQNVVIAELLTAMIESQERAKQAERSRRTR